MIYVETNLECFGMFVFESAAVKVAATVPPLRQVPGCWQLCQRLTPCSSPSGPTSSPGKPRPRHVISWWFHGFSRREILAGAIVGAQNRIFSFWLKVAFLLPWLKCTGLIIYDYILYISHNICIYIICLSFWPKRAVMNVQADEQKKMQHGRVPRKDTSAQTSTCRSTDQRYKFQMIHIYNYIYIL